MTAANQPKGEWPALLDRFVRENKTYPKEYEPRRVRRRFHGIEDGFWQGYVHISDVRGYAENIRLKHFLNRWRARRKSEDLEPTSDEIYEIMLEADDDESREDKKPFHVRRIAENISRNGVQEPIVVYTSGPGPAELWDGNRRFYGSLHIMRDDDFKEARERAQWIPAIVVRPSGDPVLDGNLKHAVLTEMNFVDKDHIPWPAYVKAEQIHNKFIRQTVSDPGDPALALDVKKQLAMEYGLKSWRVADRWIKMYRLAMEFKEYQEEEHSRDAVDVDLKIQERFEYFDELSKPGPYGAIAKDMDARDEVFSWLWDEKFQAFADVRMVPRILADKVARRQANEEHPNAVRDAIETVYANDPARGKDKDAAKEKIDRFGEWLDSFRREDFRQLDRESLERLKSILEDIVKILAGLLAKAPEAGPGDGN